MGNARVRFFGRILQATRGQREIEVSAPTVKELLDRLASAFGADFKEMILDSSGRPKTFINILVNDKDIRFSKGLDTEIKDEDRVLLIPAIGGG